MMKWAGLAFLGLIAATLWEAPETWPFATQTGIQPIVVVLDETTGETVEPDMFLLMAEGQPCSSLSVAASGRLDAASKPAIAPRTLYLSGNYGGASEVVVLQDRSLSTTGKIAIAILDAQSGCLLHQGSYLLDARSVDSMLKPMREGI